MRSTEQRCDVLTAELLPDAEKELTAYIRAVQELFGPEQVRQSVEDWIEELESMDLPAAGGIPDWRRVTIAAASRLAFGFNTQCSRMQANAEHSLIKCHKETIYVHE